MKHLLILLLVTFIPLLLKPQNYPLSHNLEIEYQLNQSTQLSLSATSMHPWIIKEPDTIKRTKGTWLSRKLFREHLLGINNSTVKFTIDPLFNFQRGYERVESKYTLTNTHGFILKGSLVKKFTFESTFAETQSVFPSYLDKFIRKDSVVPGSGVAKKLGEDGWYYKMLSGNISYTPNKNFNFQFGTGKHFIGEGYRSMLLSDQAFNYPFLRITTSFWHIKYTNLYAKLQDLSHFSDGSINYRNKNINIQLLSLDITRNINIGFFEATIWSTPVKFSNLGSDLKYLNPVIFIRPGGYNLGGLDNKVLGLMLNYRLRRTTIYGQVILDEFKLKEILAANGWWGNKQGFQIGVKSLEPFNIKGMYFLTELNQARPYTYSHDYRITNYGHYNQPLADPLGANFREWVNVLRYQKGKWILQAKLITALYGLNINNNQNYGKDIFEPYYTRVPILNNRIGQGLKTTLLYTDIHLSYVINPAIHFEFLVGMKYRKESNTSFTQKDNEFYIGFSTNLFNNYNDF